MKVALKPVLLAGVLVVFACLPASVAAVTVGDFVRATAELVGVTPGTADGMRAAGYALPEMNSAAKLTEADVVSIGAAVGVPMQTQTPRTEVTTHRAERMIAFLGSHVTSQQSPQGQGESERSDPRRRPRSRSPRIPHQGPFHHPPPTR